MWNGYANKRNRLHHKLRRIPDTSQFIGGVALKIIDYIYPIGAIIQSANSDFDPNDLYSHQTWARIKGKFLVGLDEDDTDFGAVGETGGAKGAWKHNHTVNGGATAGSFRVEVAGAGGTARNVPRSLNGTATWGVTIPAHVHNCSQEGSSNNTLSIDSANLPPYKTVYIWERTL